MIFGLSYVFYFPYFDMYDAFTHIMLYTHCQRCWTPLYGEKCS